jgi:hypothetical protein
MTWVEVLCRYRPNVLIITARQHTRAVLDRVRPCLVDPIHSCELPGPLLLRDTEFATLVLPNVGELNRGQQEELLDWLDSPTRMPIVSLHASPLFDLVVSGQFSERLYYRLNTVLLEHGDVFGITTGEYAPHSPR